MKKKIELFMTPDEALLVANNLLGSVLECLFEDKDFNAKFIEPRLNYSQQQKEKK